MKLQLIRHYFTPWGVDGELRVRDKKVADTCEHPSKYLPSGTYPITLRNLILKRGNGPMKNLDGSICVGRHVTKGCVIHSKDTFKSIYYRIQKALQRKTKVNLIIT